MSSVIKNTLSASQIEYLLTIPDISQRKTIIQKWANDQVGKYGFVWQNFDVGMGKTYMSVDLIRRIRKVTNEKIIVVVPTSTLFLSWSAMLESFENVELYVLKSFTMSKKTYDCHTLIIDEVDRAAGDSVYFNTALSITKKKYTVVLAAKLEESHVEFLEKHGLACINYIEKNVFELLQLGPKSQLITVPVELTYREKVSYAKVMSSIDIIDDWFKDLALGNKLYFFLPQILSSKGDVFINDWIIIYNRKWPDKTKEQIRGMLKGKAANFMKLIKERQTILFNAENKRIIIDKILAFENKKAFLFFNSVEAVNLYSRPNVVPYHSKLSKKQRDLNLIEFFKGKSISSIKGLIYGFDLETESKRLNVPHVDVSLAINSSYNSSKIVSIQKDGRIKRNDKKNINKIATSYYLFVDDFMYNNEKIMSQEKIWLLKSIKGQKFTIKQF